MSLHTAKEVAQRLGVPATRVHQLVREGLLPAVHLGRQVRIDSDKLDEWIESGGRTFAGGWRRLSIPSTCSPSPEALG